MGKKMLRCSFAKKKKRKEKKTNKQAEKTYYMKSRIYCLYNSMNRNGKRHFLSLSIKFTWTVHAFNN